MAAWARGGILESSSSRSCEIQAGSSSPSIKFGVGLVGGAVAYRLHVQVRWGCLTALDVTLPDGPLFPPTYVMGPVAGGAGVGPSLGHGGPGAGS